jgi:MFS family permease
MPVCRERTIERLQTLGNRLFPFGRGNVTRLAISYFFATLYFYTPVGTLYLQSKNLNYVQINSLWGLIVGTMFLAEVPTGLFADRLGRKRSINIALALQVLGEVIYVFAGSYRAFALAAVVGGLGFAFSSGCLEALVYDSLKAAGRTEEMSKAMGFISSAQRLANLLANVAGGLLIAGNLTQERFVLAIIVTACAVAVGCLISFTLREPEIEPGRGTDDSSFRLLADGVKTLKSNRRFRRLVLWSLATIPFINYLLSFYQPRFVEAGVHPLASVVTFCLLYGSMSLKDPIFSGHLNRHIDSKNRATVLSLISMFSGFYVALMGLLIGRIGDFSLTCAFVFMGIVVLAGSLAFRVRATQGAASARP